MFSSLDVESGFRCLAFRGMVVAVLNLLDSKILECHFLVSSDESKAYSKVCILPLEHRWQKWST